MRGVSRVKARFLFPVAVAAAADSSLVPRRFESVVTKLYSGNQCCLCSMRFTAAQTDMYADHLDWHFRQNHAGKVASKKITHRRWYYSLTVRRPSWNEDPPSAVRV